MLLSNQSDAMHACCMGKLGNWEMSIKHPDWGTGQHFHPSIVLVPSSISGSVWDVEYCIIIADNFDSLLLRGFQGLFVDSLDVVVPS